MAPFKNNQNLFVFKDDYSRSLGKHFLKAGIVLSFNQKNEDVFDQGSAESSQFGDAVGLHRRRRHHGQRARRPAAARAWRSTSARRGPSARSSSAGGTSRPTRRTRGRSTPRVTIDYGLRWSRFENPLDLGDTISSFDPTGVQCRARRRRLQRHAGAAGIDRLRRTRACRAARTGPNRSLAKTHEPLRSRDSASRGTSSATARRRCAPASASSTSASRCRTA